MAGPNKIQTKAFVPQTNEAILAGIRKKASSQYRERVGTATQANIEKTMRELTTDTPTWNEFSNGLMNLIGEIIYKNKVWENPLAIFKGPMLQYGDTIEEVANGLIKSYVYDPNNLYMEKMLFGQHRVPTVSSFHKINRQEFYPVTINRDILRRAFFSEYGLSEFIQGLMDAPATSDQWDEFLIMANLFQQYEDADGFYKVHVPNMRETGLSSDLRRDRAREILTQLRADAKTLTFISELYNPAGVPSFATPGELVLIATPEFQATLDVEALAQAFQVAYAEIPYRIVTLPYNQMPKDVRGVPLEAILTTEDFFVVRDTLLENTQQENVVGLTVNYYLHHHGIYSVSRFVPAIAYTTGEGTAIEIVETPVTGAGTIQLRDADNTQNITVLTRGENHVVVGAAVTTPAGGYNDGQIYSLSGNTTSKTRISQAGILWVDETESARNITVNWEAVDAQNNQYTASQTFTVVGQWVREWPNPQTIPDVDEDGNLEVTPDRLTVENGGLVLIPSVTGVQYKRAGTDVADYTVQTITASTVFTAVAKTGFELAAGATASWTLAP